MLRLTKGIAAAILAAAVLLGGAGRAAAQTATTTTTTSTTTSTTLLPHPFSKGTAACLRQAKDARRACRRTGGSGCFATFQTDFAKCFASGAGVKCATKCITTEGTCFGKVPTTRRTCRRSCFTAHTADVVACRRMADGDNIWSGGDGSCLTKAQTNYDLCHAVCAAVAVDCRTALRFCIANCANL